MTAEPAEDWAEEEERTGPERRCIASGRVAPKDGMIRFVIGPDGVVVPDVEGILPGRGIWLSASRDMVNTAVVKKLFAKAARARVTAPPDLAERLEHLLLRRCLDLLGLARRAGQVVAGFEKVRAELKAGRGAVLIAARDGAADGREKIRALAPRLPLVCVLANAELSAALGRE
ncbi:MAG: RNA-binding protein, partial [Rhodospirillales bacterium]|nr:RNA-binding protein [Rhodospirillales bacterium]